MGAREVHPSFNVGIANTGQADLIHDGNRYFVFERDEHYPPYVEHMSNAGLPYVEETPLSTETHIVGKIPRDARVLRQYARSARSGDVNMSPAVAMYAVATNLNVLADRSGVLPHPEDFSLERTMVIRKLAILAILMLPSLRFVEATDEARLAVQMKAQDELKVYARHGGIALFDEFGRALK